MKSKLLHSYSSASLSATSNKHYNYAEHRFSQVGLPEKLTHNQGVLDYIKDFKNRTFKKKILHRKVPILGWIRDYTISKFFADFVAGFTVGLTALPQGIAYSAIAGLPLQYGLYSGFIGSLLYIFFGSSKAITIGPTASLSIVTLPYVIGKPDESAILLCFLMGVVTLALGVFQMGFLVNFVSTPVISAFTSAMAVQICLTQIRPLLGIHFVGDGFLEVVEGIYNEIGNLKMMDTLLSAICMTILIFLQNSRKLAGIFFNNFSPAWEKFFWFVSAARSAIVVLGCTVIFGLIADPDLVEVIGELQPGLPPFTIPFWFSGNQTGEFVEYSWDTFLVDNKAALVVLPLLAIFEHITIAKALAGHNRVDASQEMITIGLANVVGSFFSSMPVTGNFSRTAVNHASGVQTPLGGLITAALEILALLYLVPYFYYIPNSTLAAVIVASVILNVDFFIVRLLWKTKKMDLLPWAVTFGVGLFYRLEIGILLGLLISVVYILYYAALPGIKLRIAETSSGLEFIIVELDRSLTFPAVEHSQYALTKSATSFGDDKLPLVIDCRHIQFADYTAAYGLESLFLTFNKKKQQLILWNVKPSVLRIVTGVMEINGVPYSHCNTEEDLEILLETGGKENEMPDGLVIGSKKSLTEYE